MEVKFNPGLNVNTEASQPVARQKNIPPADNPMSFERTQVLEKTLQEIPQIRPEVVARASAMVENDSYPSDEALNQMAGLLTSRLSGEPS